MSLLYGNVRGTMGPAGSVWRDSFGPLAKGVGKGLILTTGNGGVVGCGILRTTLVGDASLAFSDHDSRAEAGIKESTVEWGAHRVLFPCLCPQKSTYIGQRSENRCVYSGVEVYSDISAFRLTAIIFRAFYTNARPPSYSVRSCWVYLPFLNLANRYFDIRRY